MANKTSFKKGQVANPKGKAKGTLSKHKQQFNEIRKLAGNDANQVYKLLKQEMEAGEAWAHQIYWKTLYPKNGTEDSVKVKVPSTIGKEGIEEFTNKFVVALQGFEDFTKDEVMQVIKTLSSIKELENRQWAADNLPQLMFDLLDTKSGDNDKKD